MICHFEMEWNGNWMARPLSMLFIKLISQSATQPAIKWIPTIRFSYRYINFYIAISVYGMMWHGVVYIECKQLYTVNVFNFGHKISIPLWPMQHRVWRAEEKEGRKKEKMAHFLDKQKLLLNFDLCECGVWCEHEIIIIDNCIVNLNIVWSDCFFMALDIILFTLSHLVDDLTFS